MIAPFFSTLPQSFDSKLQQTNTKTDENGMHFPLYFSIILSCERMIRHLTLTAFASVAIKERYSIISLFIGLTWVASNDFNSYLLYFNNYVPTT